MLSAMCCMTSSSQFDHGSTESGCLWRSGSTWLEEAFLVDIFGANKGTSSTASKLISAACAQELSDQRYVQ